MRRIIAVAAVGVILAFGMGATANASQEEEVTVTTTTQECVPVEGQEYIAPTFETQPNPDYIPAWTETIEHPAVIGIEYKWVKYVQHGPDQYQWSPTDPGASWHPYPGGPFGQWSREYTITEAWTETIEHPAVGSETIEVEIDPGQPAIEEVICPTPDPSPSETVTPTPATTEPGDSDQEFVNKLAATGPGDAAMWAVLFLGLGFGAQWLRRRVTV